MKKLFNVKPHWQDTGLFFPVLMMEFTNEAKEAIGLSGNAVIIGDESISVYTSIEDFYDGESEVVYASTRKGSELVESLKMDWPEECDCGKAMVEILWSNGIEFLLKDNTFTIESETINYTVDLDIKREKDKKRYGVGKFVESQSGYSYTAIHFGKQSVGMDIGLDVVDGLSHSVLAFKDLSEGQDAKTKPTHKENQSKVVMRFENSEQIDNLIGVLKTLRDEFQIS